MVTISSIVRLTLFVILIVLIVTQNSSKLVMMQQVHRHGARYPIYPRADDNSTYAHTEHSTGQLTNQGKSMHYRLGQQLFLEYWSRLFGNNMVYNQSNFYVKSTNVNRTIESVQSQLFGILENLTPLNLSIFEVQYAQPPWSKNIYAYEGIISTYTGPVFEGGPKYHPIPVHVENGGMNPYDRGDFLRTYSPQICPKQSDWIEYNIYDSRVLQIINHPSFDKAITLLSKTLNKTLTFWDVAAYYDNYICMKYMNRKGSTTQATFQTDRETTRTFQAIYTLDLYLKLFATRQQLAITATGFFAATIQNMQNIINNKTAPKWIIYSAHDTTLGNYLAAMNLTNYQCIFTQYLQNDTRNSDTCLWKYPTFASTLIFELLNNTYGNTSVFTFKVRYNGEYRKIPFCGLQLQCNYTTLVSWFNSWKDDNYLKSCGIKDNTSEAYFSFAIVQLMVILIIALIALIGYLKKNAIPHALKKEIDTTQQLNEAVGDNNGLRQTLITEDP